MTLAEGLNRVYQLQHMGFILENIECMDDELVEGMIEEL